MNSSKSILSLITVLWLVAGTAFGDVANEYINRGNARYGKGDLDGALADYDKAIELNPKDALAYYNRGNVKDKTGDVDGALADYGKAIKLKPKDALAYYNRGNAKYRKGDLDGALADANKAVE